MILTKKVSSIIFHVLIYGDASCHAKYAARQRKEGRPDDVYLKEMISLRWLVSIFPPTLILRVRREIFQTRYLSMYGTVPLDALLDNLSVKVGNNVSERVATVNHQCRGGSVAGHWIAFTWRCQTVSQKSGNEC